MMMSWKVYRRKSRRICTARAVSLLIFSVFLIAIGTGCVQSSSVVLGTIMLVENSPQNPDVLLADDDSEEDGPNPAIAENILRSSDPRILTRASRTADLAAVQVTRVTVLRL